MGVGITKGDPPGGVEGPEQAPTPEDNDRFPSQIQSASQDLHAAGYLWLDVRRKYL